MCKFQVQSTSQLSHWLIVYFTICCFVAVPEEELQILHLENIQSNILSDIYIDLSLEEDEIDINQDKQYMAISAAINAFKKA